jgi:hypothetical protein
MEKLCSAGGGYSRRNLRERTDHNKRFLPHHPVSAPPPFLLPRPLHASAVLLGRLQLGEILDAGDGGRKEVPSATGDDEGRGVDGVGFVRTLCGELER